MANKSESQTMSDTRTYESQNKSMPVVADGLCWYKVVIIMTKMMIVAMSMMMAMCTSL